jgi:hypothetical protein
MLTFDILVYAHLLAGGLAVVAIGWRAGWPVAACVLAAVVFMFGGCASSRMQHTGAILTYAMFPPSELAAGKWCELVDFFVERQSKGLVLRAEKKAKVFISGALSLVLSLDEQRKNKKDIKTKKVTGARGNAPQEILECTIFGRTKKEQKDIKTKKVTGVWGNAPHGISKCKMQI